MFKPGTKVLFQEPTSDVQLLRSASVVESHEDSFSIQFDGDPIELDEGLELIAYFHAGRDFMQQVVRVIALVEDGDMFSGTASVLSIREFSPTRIRYGLRALGGRDLEDGLRQISLRMQRQQFKGQSGAG